MRTWRVMLLVAAVAAAAAAATMTASCGGQPSENGGTGGQTITIVYGTAGGAFSDAVTRAWINPFLEAHPNIRIIQDMPMDYAKIKAMEESGNVTWDIIDTGNDFGLGESEQYLVKLDPAYVPFDELQPNLLPTGGYRAAMMVYSSVIAYRPDLLNDQVPHSFADFFDLKKFPGKRGCFNWAGGGLLEMALLADGVPSDQLYPLDIERAFKKIDTIKDSIIWWTTGSQSAQLLTDGEVTMGMSWNGRIADAQAQGAKTQIMWDQHMVIGEYLEILKGAKNQKECLELIQWITSAEHNAELSYFIPYGPANSNAADKVNPEADLPTAHMATAIPIDDLWWGQNNAKVTEQWQNWIQQ